MKINRWYLYMALAALALTLAAGHWVREDALPTQSRAVLAARDGYILSVGDTPPAGETVLLDRDTLFQGNLLYVSADAPLPKDIPAQQSRDVRSLVGLYIPAAERVSLSEETIYALCDLVAANPLLSTWVMTGMRSPGEQTALQTKAFASYQSTMPVAQALEQARRDVPDSGQSEHQLATVFDVRLDGPQSWSQSDPMARTADGCWLLEHAWEYGFIRRYPPNKSALTGVQNETTHWRYVGRLHAAAMHMADWCLEEYLDALHTYGALRLETPEGEVRWIFCAPLEDAARFSLPPDAVYEASADNLGWAVCAVYPVQSSR